jgi:hypothetical protein
MPRIKRDEINVTARASTLVNRRILPGVQEREDLNRLLRVHDPEVAAANRAEITAKHAPLLRQIALEGPHAGGDPGARERAIAWLGRFAAPAATILPRETIAVIFEPLESSPIFSANPASVVASPR